MCTSEMEQTEKSNPSHDVEKDTFNTSGFATPLAPSRSVHFLTPTPVSRSRKQSPLFKNKPLDTPLWAAAMKKIRAESMKLLAEEQRQSLTAHTNDEAPSSSTMDNGADDNDNDDDDDDVRGSSDVNVNNNNTSEEKRGEEDDEVVEEEKRKKKKKNKVVVFKRKDLELMKRNRLVSVAKRAGIRANQSSEALRQALAAYYESNRLTIEERQTASRSGNNNNKS